MYCFDLISFFLGLYRILIWPDSRPTILPDTGYPVWPDIRVIINIEYFFSKKNIEIFSFQQNLPTFLVPISLLFYTHWKGSEKSLLIRSSHHFNRISGQPDIQYNPTISVNFLQSCMCDLTAEVAALTLTLTDLSSVGCPVCLCDSCKLSFSL